MLKYFKRYQEPNFQVINNIWELEFKKILELIQPIKNNVEQKKNDNEWDDYDEWAHAIQWLKIIKNQKIEITCFIYKIGTEIKGVAFTSKDRWIYNIHKNIFSNFDVNTCVKFGPFHISKEARGIGEKWIKEKIIPQLKEGG